MYINMTDSEADEDCAICGESMQCKFTHEMRCKHTFHYECLLKTLLVAKHTRCPYCRKSGDLLPLVNGLNKLHKGVHYKYEKPEDYVSSPCSTLLKSGKRKGQPCGATCMMGYDMCTRHKVMSDKQKKKVTVTKEKKTKVVKDVIIKKMGLGDALEQVQVDQLLEVTASLLLIGQT
jgi:hypothetical protein